MTELGADQAGCCVVTLSATPIHGATYAWYRSSDDFTSSIGSGSTYNVPNGHSYTYKCITTLSGQTAWDYVKGSNAETSCCRLAGSPDPFYAVPNPTDDAASIRYILPEYTTTGKITIADVTGKVIRSIPVSKENGSVELDCKQLSNGIYFYSLHVGERILSSKKLVIAK